MVFRSQGEVRAKNSTRVQIKSWLFQKLGYSLVPQGSLNTTGIRDTRDPPAFPYIPTYMQISEIHPLNLGHSREDPYGLFTKHTTLMKPSMFSRHPCMSKSQALLKVTSNSAFSPSPHLSYKLQWPFILFCWHVSLLLLCSYTSHSIPQSSSHSTAGTIFKYMYMCV